LTIMRDFGVPVIMDATHAVQKPGSADGGNSTGGNRDFVPIIVRAAAAVGVDGFFIETHPNPDEAKSDGPNSVILSEMESLLAKGKAIHELARSS
ncbi:MAG: 3-deoxy-8-phosphooctulonate synthase, partial [Lentisphaeria bacterium]|nr:3-deoxy-8-phosphooctulonate synthase [Lentisphaeria bacterium]